MAAREIDREKIGAVPRRADITLQAPVRDAATSFGLPFWTFSAGAVQDARQIATIAPMAMILILSRNGISRSLFPEDVANGAEVLYRAVLLLEERLSRN